MSDRDESAVTSDSHTAQTRLRADAPTIGDDGATLAAAPSDPTARHDPTWIGPYHLLKKLGEGGMGQVWLAEQTAPLHRQVALKLIKVGMYDDSVLQRFQAERQSLAMMEHPSIAKVFDAGATPDGQPYFVMEYVPGLPITEYCDQKRLKIRERLELFVKVCEGVQHAHQKAIMHRDLKPANILVVEVDGKPVPRIIDFGLAKTATPQVGSDPLFTQVGGWVGTPGYMSPEQADPRVVDVDTRTDVYSLGAVLYVLLTGFLPFETKDWRKQRFDEFLRCLLEEDPPRPSTKIGMQQESSRTTAEARGSEPKHLAGLLHGDLDWITMRALEKDRARRYGTPSELATDIGRYLNHQPVVARPAGTGYRLQKYVRRHRMGVAVAAGLVLLLTGFAVMQAIQLRQTTRERDRATRERDRATRVTDFMTNMFKGFDPSEARGNTITAREILDNASKDITGLANDADTQAQMMQVMGEVYESLGLYPQAQSLFAQAVDTRRRVLGAENPETLSSMNRLSRLLLAQGRYVEAEKLQRDTLAIQRRVLGPEHQQTLTSMSSLAITLGRQGHFDEAEKMKREILEIRRRVLGTDDAATLASMNSLAVTLDDLGRYAEAENLYREVIANRRRLLGPEHPDTLAVMDNLAVTLDSEGRYAEAEKLEREILDIERRILGPEHPDTLISMNNLGQYLHHQGHHAEAAKVYRETVDIRRRVLGPEHPYTLSSMIGLGSALSSEGRYGEAEKLQRETLDIQRRVLGPDDPETPNSLNNLAETLEREGRHAEAERFAREAVETTRRVRGPEHPTTLEFMDTLARAQFSKGHHAEAEKLYRQTLDIRRRVLGSEHPNTAVSMYHVGCVVARQRRRSEALSLLREAVDHGLPPNLGLGIDKDSNLKSLHGDPRFDALVARAKERAAAAGTKK